MKKPPAKPGTGSRPRRPRHRRLSRTRLLIWGIEAAVLAAAVYFCLWLPRQRRTPPAPEPEPPPKRPVPVFDRTPALPPDLIPVRTAGFPNTAPLATGSLLAQKTQETYARRHRLPVEVRNRFGMRFRLVPPGPFLMGSPPSERGRWPGEVQHVRTVEHPLYVGVHEITQEQWEAAEAPVRGDD